MRRVKKKIDIYSWYTWVLNIIFKGLRRNKNHIRQSRFLFQSSNRLVTPDFQPHFEPRRFYIYNRPTCCQNIRTRSVLIVCNVHGDVLWQFDDGNHPAKICSVCTEIQRKTGRFFFRIMGSVGRQCMTMKKSRRNNEDNEDISKRNNVIWRQIGCEHSQNYTIGFHQRYI